MTRILSRLVLGLWVLSAAPACGGSSGPREGSTDPLAMGGSAGVAMGGSAGMAGGGSPTLDAPDEEVALIAFLEAKEYLGWAKETDFHESAGPHGDRVRVYYSPKAAAAVQRGAETLPAGAATVKELTSGASLYGYAVWVKVQDATDAGNGFYWYERIAQGGGNFSIYGNARGSTDCVDCHSTGKDYNLSTLPFD